MKKQRIPALSLTLLTILLLASCDMINDFIADRTRNIAVIQIYNSNFVKTNKLQPNDTLYVEVQGLAPGGFYQVECLDPKDKVITMMTAEADENGVIAPTPLWYDVGFKKEYIDVGGGVYQWKAALPTGSELGIRAFNIHVVSLDDTDKSLAMTDFKLPFFVVFNTDLKRPQPIVMAGRMIGTDFFLENSFGAGEALYIKTENLDELPTPAPASGKAAVYIVPFAPGHYEDGYRIDSNFVVKQLVDVDDLKAGVEIDADPEAWFDDVNVNTTWSPIPDDAKGHAFSVFVDVNDNGIYEVKKDGTDDYYLDGIDGNGVAGFIVKDDDPAPAVDYIPANIASGGMTWGHAWFEGWPDYDYRDQFHADGYDTQYGWDWQFSGYGVKALWNPYIDKNIDDEPNSDSILYYGRYVDLYIVLASDMDLSGTNTLVAAPGTRKLTLPVQYACTNGANQQTIWRAPMVVGKYCVVVDLDRDEHISKGDIIDNLHENGSAWTDGGNPVGFEVE